MLDERVSALRRVTATRYVTPLREGGSLPGLVEADDLGTYVAKFTGAGQGPKALVAEVAGELGRRLGLRVPELVVLDLDPVIARAEPDWEVQELLARSGGPNLGMDFLPGALDLDPVAFAVDPAFAGRVLWFDALVSNVDRTWRNVNMLRWHGAPYLIDHGATLTFHHSWTGPEPPEVVAAGAARPYDASTHVVLRSAPDLDAADAALAPHMTPDLLRAVTDVVPDLWLDVPGFADPAQVRAAYVARLDARLDARDAWLPGLRAAVAAATGRRRS